EDRDDLGEVGETLHERVLDRLAEPPGEGEEARRRQVLRAKEDDELLQPGPTDGRDRLVTQVLREIDAGDLSTDGAGDGVHREGLAHSILLSGIVYAVASS